MSKPIKKKKRASVKIKLVRYKSCSTGETVWFEQALEPAAAKQTARLLALKGHTPTIFTVKFDPEALVSTAKVKRCRVVTCSTCSRSKPDNL